MESENIFRKPYKNKIDEEDIANAQYRGELNNFQDRLVEEFGNKMRDDLNNTSIYISGRQCGKTMDMESLLGDTKRKQLTELIELCEKENMVFYDMECHKTISKEELIQLAMDKKEKQIAVLKVSNGEISYNYDFNEKTSILVADEYSPYPLTMPEVCKMQEDEFDRIIKDERKRQKNFIERKMGKKGKW